MINSSIKKINKPIFNSTQTELFEKFYSLEIIHKMQNSYSLKNYRFIDLFAGIGGIRIGFDKLNAKCVFASEWDKFSQITYQKNFHHTVAGDITKIDEKDIPEFDILLAGFPCQPFSNAGKKQGFDDIRGTLFFDICRIISYHKPQVILLENVKGFKSHDKGRTYGVVRKNLEDLGYKIFTQILNSKDFGLAQNRERIYMVCFKDPVKFQFPLPFANSSKLGNILEKEVPQKYTISDKLWQGHKRRKDQHLAKGNGFGYSIFNENSTYTSTISARYYKDGSEILIEQENKNPRKITPREAARLQGFPEDFIIPVSDVQAYKQFGNSVSVPVIEAIAVEIAKALAKK